MPAHKGIASTCLLCSYSGRSDAVKRHIRSVHKTFTAEGKYVACKEGRVIAINSSPYPEVKRYLTGVCLDCGDTIKLREGGKKQVTNHLTTFENHNCKPKQERDGSVGDTASEASVAPKPRRQAPPSDTEPEDEDEDVPYDAYEVLYEELYGKFLASPLPEDKKNSILNLFENKKDANTTYHRGAPILRFKDTLVSIVEDLANR